MFCVALCSSCRFCYVFVYMRRVFVVYVYKHVFTSMCLRAKRLFPYYRPRMRSQLLGEEDTRGCVLVGLSKE